jgi:hypothetical protein
VINHRHEGIAFMHRTHSIPAATSHIQEEHIREL